jgi:hypothetical protein
MGTGGPPVPVHSRSREPGCRMVGLECSIAIQGDITPMWSDGLDRATRERSLQLRGIATESSRFCLSVLISEITPSAQQRRIKPLKSSIRPSMLRRALHETRSGQYGFHLQSRATRVPTVVHPSAVSILGPRSADPGCTGGTHDAGWSLTC